MATYFSRSYIPSLLLFGGISLSGLHATPATADCASSATCGVQAQNVAISEAELPFAYIPVTVRVDDNMAAEGLRHVLWHSESGTAEKNVDFVVADFYIDPFSSSWRADASDKTTDFTFNIPVYIFDDDLIEGDETFSITFTTDWREAESEYYVPPLDYYIPAITKSITVTLQDDDSLDIPPRISAKTDHFYRETEEHAIVDLTMGRAQDVPATVKVQATGGMAQKGLDYLDTVQFVTFNPGETTARAYIPLVDDLYLESNGMHYQENKDTVIVEIFDPVNARITTNQVSFTITDNEFADLNWHLWDQSYAGRYGPNDVHYEHWAKDEISATMFAGIGNYCDQKAFNYCPKDPLKHDEFAKWLGKAAKGTEYIYRRLATGNRYADVGKRDKFAHWIEEVDRLRIDRGFGATYFKPDIELSRAQVAFFSVRARYGVDYVPPAAAGIFKDVPANHWAAPYIEKLVNEGIVVNGCDRLDYFCPGKKITREVAAVWMSRLFDLL